MEFRNVIARRQSVRSYQEKQITEEQLQALLEAANAAPVCMGQFDHVHLTVVQSPAVLAKINAKFAAAVGDEKACPTYGAPTVIYVSNMASDEEVIVGANASCIVENMLLAATEMGLANVYLFGVSQVLLNDSEVAALLKLPEGFRTVSAIAVGYANEELNERPLTCEKIAMDRI